MWDEGVSVFDAHANEEFTLRAMVLCTVNDFSTYGNLSVNKNKVKNACPICINDMEFTCANMYHAPSEIPPTRSPISLEEKSIQRGS